MSADCAFCLADLPDDSESEWCNAACKGSWSLLFADPVDFVPDGDVYDDLDGALVLPPR